MAKTNYLKALWIASPAGGGVSFSSPFVEYDEHYVKGPNGRLKHYRSDTPTAITVLVARGDDTFVKKGKEEFILEEGEFVVQDNNENVIALKELVQTGMIEMVDSALHYQYLDEEEPEMIEEVITTGKMIEVNPLPKNSPAAKREKEQKQLKALQEANKAIRKEKSEEYQAKFDTFDALKSIKIKKASIIDQIIEKDIETMEQLAETNKDILLTITGIGGKVADSIIKEAKELTASKEE